MALWALTDEDSGKPKFLSDALKNGQTVSDKDLTIGIDASEVKDATSISRGLKTPGWVKYITYTDAQGNVRHKSEVLVVASSFNTDGNVTLSDDLGLVNLDYPTPGSGSYASGSAALAGVTYSAIGTPAEPTGGITTVQNSSSGLLRSKYDGNFCASALNVIDAYNLNFFNGLTPLKSISDSNLSWGAQSDGDSLGEHNFSMEWTGYIKLNAGSSPLNWNFYVESDDTCAVWIGSEAISGFNATNYLVSSSNKTLPGQAASSRGRKTLTLDGNKYYPIRIWFSEFTGGCRFQLYALAADGTKWNGSNMTLVHNSLTNGYNPA